MGNSLEATKLVVTASIDERSREEWVVIESAASFDVPKLEARDSDSCSNDYSPCRSEQDLNTSFDSGYEELDQNAALEKPTTELKSKPSDPDHQPCRTDSCLGQHHSYYDIRLFQYDEDCEGNRHITDEDL